MGSVMFPSVSEATAAKGGWMLWQHVARPLFVALSAALVFVLTPGVVFGQAANIYLANTAQGGNTGADCADAYAWTWFNTASNWGTGANQIGPGTTVHLCGTITASPGSSMTVHGSGTSGNPITIKFESGAILQAPYWGSGGGEGECPCTGAITISGYNYITVDGGGTPASGNNPAGLATVNGIVQNTANGTGLAYQSYSPAIYIKNATGITVKNLEMQNIYVHTNSDSLGLAPRMSDDIILDGTLSAITIQNNILNNAGKGVEIEGTDYGNTPTNIANNYIGDHCWGMYVGNTASPSIFGNEITDWTDWGSNASDCHSDGIIVYGSPATPYIYNNYFHASLDPVGTGSATAYIHCTYGASAGNTSHCTIFNNIFAEVTTNAAGFFTSFYGGETGPHYVYNNTYVNVIYPSSAIDFASSGTPESVTVKNNVIVGSGGSAWAMLWNNGGPISDIAGSDYNDWYNLRTYAWYGDSFSQWQAAGYDTHSVSTNPSLSSSFPYTLQSGSPAIGSGTNLTSLCTGQLAPLCQDRLGNPRPATGAWDMGASQSQQQVAPPTGLTSTAH